MPDGSIPWLSTAGGNRRFLWLLVLFILYPAALVALPPGAVRYAALDVVAMGLYVATWCPTGRLRRLALGAVGFGAVLLVGLVTASTGPGASAAQPLTTARALMLFLFFAAIMLAALVDVLRHQRVTLDMVLGAVCVYLLMGAMWGALYDLTAIHQPGAFRIATGSQSSSRSGSVDGGLSFVDSIYFSYATLTTVGLGDIVPTTVASRTLVWTEAVTGQIYLVVLIARLVSLQIVHAGVPTPAPRAQVDGEPHSGDPTAETGCVAGQCDPTTPAPANR